MDAEVAGKCFCHSKAQLVAYWRSTAEGDGGSPATV
jgi:hypothetical protein